MTDTSDTAIARMIHAAPFADNTAGIPEMVAMLLALQAERKAGWVARVKPLEWVSEGGDEYAEAFGLIYLLCDPSSSDECNGWYVLEESTNTVIEADGSPEAAKTAAQADYAARVLTALIPNTEAKP